MVFSDDELERYARHIVLREIGGVGQGKLSASRVLVIGAGGLGAPVLMYLAAAGIGHLGIVDDDTVSLSNLQRQVLFGSDDIGKPKGDAAKAALARINSHVEVEPHHMRFGPSDGELISDYDLVIDGCDNFETRYAVNAACVVAKTPLISGAIAQWEGQVSVFDPANGGPCYACVFPNEPADGLAPSCAEAGVMGALAGVVGSMMAGEAIKQITGAGAPLRGSMMIHDALWGENRVMKLRRAQNCTVCGDG